MGYQAVQADIVSIIPTSGPSSGGTDIQVGIDYFPYPADGGAIIHFNGDVVDSSAIQILDVSTKLRTFLSFTPPASSPGEAFVRIAPANCTHPCVAVYTTFLQVDSTMPVLMAPIPSRGCLSAHTMPTLSFTQFPAGLVDSMNVSFSGSKGTFRATADPGT